MVLTRALWCILTQQWFPSMSLMTNDGMSCISNNTFVASMAWNFCFATNNFCRAVTKEGWKHIVQRLIRKNQLKYLGDTATLIFGTCQPGFWLIRERILHQLTDCSLSRSEVAACNSDAPHLCWIHQVNTIWLATSDPLIVHMPCTAWDSIRGNLRADVSNKRRLFVLSSLVNFSLEIQHAESMPTSNLCTLAPSHTLGTIHSLYRSQLTNQPGYLWSDNRQ